MPEAREDFGREERFALPRCYPRPHAGFTNLMSSIDISKSQHGANAAIRKISLHLAKELPN